MKYFQYILFIVWIISGNSLWAQTTQRGVVVEVSSGNKTIIGASIIALGAIPADSDSGGKFELVFSNIKPGGRVVIKQIYKEGYEIVNEEDIRKWVLSDKHNFKIVLCRKGRLEESRRRFYDIGQDRYYTLYQQARKELHMARENGKITIDRYNEKVEKVNDEYTRALSELNFYADKFARINKDELNELDNKALALVEEGQIDEAIKLYEEAKILQKFKEKQEQHDTAHVNTVLLAEALEKEIVLLKESGNATATNKIDSIYRVLIKQDARNYRYYRDYARFIRSSENSEDAFSFYLKALELSRSRGERNEICRDMDELLRLLPGRDANDSYEQRIKEALRVWDEKEELENLKK